VLVGSCGPVVFELPAEGVAAKEAEIAACDVSAADSPLPIGSCADGLGLVSAKPAAATITMASDAATAIAATCRRCSFSPGVRLGIGEASFVILLVYKASISASAYA
jgi:hypothetical protein